MNWQYSGIIPHVSYIQTGEIIIHKSNNDETTVEVKQESQTLWLSFMAQLAGKDSDTIELHIKNMNAEDELDEKSNTVVFTSLDVEMFNELNSTYNNACPILSL
jgi:hypothetical protein